MTTSHRWVDTQMTMVPCDEEVGAANTAAHDLCFVVDGTGSMT